jgi:hypothetical protein
VSVTNGSVVFLACKSNVDVRIATDVMNRCGDRGSPLVYGSPIGRFVNECELHNRQAENHMVNGFRGIVLEQRNGGLGFDACSMFMTGGGRTIRYCAISKCIRA